MNAEPDYRLLMEELCDAAYVVEPGPRGVCLYMSPGIEDLTGYPARRWETDPLLWKEAIHGDDLDRVVEMFSRSGPRTIEYRLIRVDGEVIWVLDRSVAEVRDDGSMLRQGALVDVTERRERERQSQRASFFNISALIHAEEELEHQREIYEQVPADMWATDGDLNVITVCGSTAEVVGFDLQEQPLNIRDAAQQSVESKKIIDVHEKALEGQITVYTVDGFGGRRQVCEVVPRRQDGEIVGVIGVAIDITALNEDLESTQDNEDDRKTQ